MGRALVYDGDRVSFQRERDFLCLCDDERGPGIVAARPLTVISRP